MEDYKDYDAGLHLAFGISCDYMKAYANKLYKVNTNPKGTGDRVELYDDLDKLSDWLDLVLERFNPVIEIKQNANISALIKELVLNYHAASFAFEEAFKKELVTCYRDDDNCRVITSEKSMQEELQKKMHSIASLVLEYNGNFKKEAQLFKNDPDFLEHQICVKKE